MSAHIERQLLGGYKDTRWELVRVGGVKYLAKRYSPANHAVSNHISLDE